MTNRKPIFRPLLKYQWSTKPTLYYLDNYFEDLIFLVRPQINIFGMIDPSHTRMWWSSDSPLLLRLPNNLTALLPETFALTWKYCALLIIKLHHLESVRQFAAVVFHKIFKFNLYRHCCCRNGTKCYMSHLPAAMYRHFSEYKWSCVSAIAPISWSFLTHLYEDTHLCNKVMKHGHNVHDSMQI